MPQAKPVAGRCWSLLRALSVASSLKGSWQCQAGSWASSTLPTTSWQVHTWSVLVAAEKQAGLCQGPWREEATSQRNPLG